MTIDIQDAATKFEERVKALLHIKVENIDKNVAIVKEDVVGIKDGVDGVSKDISAVDKKTVAGFKQGYKMISSLEDQLQGIAADVECA